MTDVPAIKNFLKNQVSPIMLNHQGNSMLESSAHSKATPQAYKAPAFALLWASPSAWQEANQTLDHLIQMYDIKLKTAKSLARSVRKNLESIFPILDQVNALTCPWCPDTCCIAAKIWFDFKDLVFLHLNGLTIPSAQPIKSLKDSCRYLGPKGCTLNRTSRPWICTWYLCPTQTAILRKNTPQSEKKISKAFKAVKDSYRKMEWEFIQVTSGK